MLTGFKEFVSRGNVLDLAVAVVIGAAFTRIVTSLTDDIIMPLVGRLAGDLDFSAYFVRLGPLPEGFAGNANDYAALKAAGVPMLGYGEFVTAAINFLIVSLILYLVVKAFRKAVPEAQSVEAEAVEIALLREIRDELRARPGS